MPSDCGYTSASVEKRNPRRAYLCCFSLRQNRFSALAQLRRQRVLNRFRQIGNLICVGSICPPAPPVVTSGILFADNKQSAPLWAVHYQWHQSLRITHAHILRYVIRRHEIIHTVTRHSGLIWRIRSAITSALPAQRYRAGHEFADWYW